MRYAPREGSARAALDEFEGRAHHRHCALPSTNAARWGVAGLKIDFINSCSQESVTWCEKVLEEAAARHLLVDFHGMYVPTGLARTWPNFITQEGVRGNEYNQFSSPPDS
ncbi:MAG: glycoside hydrolase family 97 catalytic domain-containing protein [Verrucomicrobiota bacterium]